MGRRLELQALLESVLETGRVYFQPPESVQLEYPCIVYHRDYAHSEFADDLPYMHRTRYQVIVIDPDPDSEIPAKIAQLPMCLFDRFYTANKLNHDSFKLFF